MTRGSPCGSPARPPDILTLEGVIAFDNDTFDRRRDVQDRGLPSRFLPPRPALGGSAATALAYLRLIHLPIHASWLNQVEIYLSVVQRKLPMPNDFHDLDELETRLPAFQDYYQQISTPFE
jgi:hypothetical protein